MTTDKPEDISPESAENQPQEPAGQPEGVPQASAEAAGTAESQEQTQEPAAESTGGEAVSPAAEGPSGESAEQAPSAEGVGQGEAAQASAEQPEGQPAEQPEQASVSEPRQPTAEVAGGEQTEPSEAPQAETSDQLATDATAAEQAEPASGEAPAQPEATTETDQQPEAGVPELTLGAGAPREPGEELEPIPAGTIRGKVDKFGVAWGTGRRKTSVARVRVRDGKGLLFINGRRLEDYFKLEVHRQQVEAPLKATGFYGKVDVIVRVSGGGISGQAGAIALGIARALEAKQPTLHQVLSDGGYLTRDDRMVERKKYGLKKARKRPQFSKR